MGQDYQDLVAWQKGMRLAETVYELTRNFPSDERFGLISQMRRAAVSVPSNIAEGQGRLTAGEYRQFLSNALGSARELETQVILATRLGYVEQHEARPVLALIADTGRLINRLAAANLATHGKFTRQNA